MKRFKNEKSTIITIKPDGSTVVTESEENNYYKDTSEEAIVGQLWSNFKRQ